MIKYYFAENIWSKHFQNWIILIKINKVPQNQQIKWCVVTNMANVQRKHFKPISEQSYWIIENNMYFGKKTDTKIKHGRVKISPKLKQGFSILSWPRLQPDFNCCLLDQGFDGAILFLTFALCTVFNHTKRVFSEFKIFNAYCIYVFY